MLPVASSFGLKQCDQYEFELETWALMHWLGFTAGANPALRASLSSGVEKRASFRPETSKHSSTISTRSRPSADTLSWICHGSVIPRLDCLTQSNDAAMTLQLTTSCVPTRSSSQLDNHVFTGHRAFCSCESFMVRKFQRPYPSYW